MLDKELQEEFERVVRLTHEELNKLKDAKNTAYSERNRLVALISKLFPSSLERHSESDKYWEDDWRWIVFVDLPTGQCSWHIHDSELPMFDHLARNCGREWDGHTTDEKYARIEKMHDRKFLEAVEKSHEKYGEAFRQLADL